MSKSQLKYNLKIEGGFLAALARLAARALPFLASAANNILPTLGTGVLSGLASSGMQKALGNSLYLKKVGCAILNKMGFGMTEKASYLTYLKCTNSRNIGMNSGIFRNF